MSRVFTHAYILPVIDSSVHVLDESGTGVALGPYPVCPLPVSQLITQLSSLALLEVFGEEYTRKDGDLVAKRSFLTVHLENPNSALMFAHLPFLSQDVVVPVHAVPYINADVAIAARQIARIKQHRGLYDQISLSQPGIHSFDLESLERKLLQYNP